MGYYFHQAFFVIRDRYMAGLRSTVRKIWYRMIGMKVGKNTYLPPIEVTWPHQVSLGKDCMLEHGIHFKFDGIWKDGPSILIGDNVFIGMGAEFNIRQTIRIGNNSLIAS